jgi:hypothetical protein
VPHPHGSRLANFTTIKHMPRASGSSEDDHVWAIVPASLYESISISFYQQLRRQVRLTAYFITGNDPWPHCGKIEIEFPIAAAKIARPSPSLS